MQLTYEAWPGTRGTVHHTPDRRPGSIRRTTSIRTTGDLSLDGVLNLAGQGRDLVTTGSGADVVDQVRLEARARGPLRTLETLRIRPGPSPDPTVLLGSTLMSGFRRAVSSALPFPDGSVLGLLLDDLPGATLVSGSARIRAVIESEGEMPAYAAADMPVVCIGTRLDGVMARRRRQGRPLLGQGPPAGELDRADDPLAWPPEETLPVHGMRRLRRIDVSVAGDAVVADAHFRDSHMDTSGVETSVHEYQVEATAGRGDGVVRAVSVIPRVLPGPDCPGAAAGAQSIVGQRLPDLRRFVRAALTNDRSCTHLDDLLRSLADVPAMVASLERFS